MDNQDQRRTHTQGQDNHGVYVCHKCGWPFPNPHPSAKHRRAHKKICGTIEGYTLCVSECQTHFDPSDDEHYSDDNHKRQGLKALDIGGNNDKAIGGIGENSIRSVDEVFSDAVTDFSDGILSPGVKESLRDSLDSATDLEIIHHIRYPEFSLSSGENDSNDESNLIVKSRNDGQMQDSKILQTERVEVGNMLELKGQFSSSTVNSLTSLVADMKTEALTVVPTNDCFDLTSDSKPSKSEAMSDVLLDNKIYACENMTACGLTSVSIETVLKENDEIKSDEDMVDIVVSPDNTRGEIFEGESNIEVSDVVNSNYQVADVAFNLKEKSSAESPIMMPHDDFPLGGDSAVSTSACISGIRVDSAHMIELATSSDAKTLQEREEGNVHVLTCRSSDDRPNVPHPQSEDEDCHINKGDEGVVSQKSSSLHSSKALEQEGDELEDSDNEENDFLTNLDQLSEKRVVFSQDMHAEEIIDVFPVTFNAESSKSLHENGAYMSAMKTEMHVVNFSERAGSDDLSKNSQQVNFSEGSFMAVSNENPRDASFGSSTSQTATVISRDNRSPHEKNITGINDIGVDGKCKEANSGNYTGISMKTLLPSNLYPEIRQSSLYMSEDAVEMNKLEKCDIKDTPLPASSHFESLIPSQEDIKDVQINDNSRFNEDSDRIASTTADYRQSQNGELSLNPTEDLGRDNSMFSSLNIESTAQPVSAAEDSQDGEPGTEVPGVVADPIQEQNVLSVQSGAQAVIDSEPSNNLLASTEEGKLNLEDPTAASKIQQSENTEMFEPPSFMTLVEPGLMVGAKAAESEETESNKEHPGLTSSQAGWFPTLTHVTNESQGRKRNEEIIAKVTKQNTPLKSLLSEAANNSKPKPPKSEKKSANQEKGKVAEDNSSGLTTVNSILGSESPAIQVVKGESSEEWNSQTSYPSEIKREKKKSKSRPYFIQFLCCSSVETKSR